jgi:hypothetical protein
MRCCGQRSKAADLIKLAMTAVQNWLETENSQHHYHTGAGRARAGGAGFGASQCVEAGCAECGDAVRREKLGVGAVERIALYYKPKATQSAATNCRKLECGSRENSPRTLLLAFRRRFVYFANCRFRVSLCVARFDI